MKIMCHFGKIAIAVRFFDLFELDCGSWNFHILDIYIQETKLEGV